MPADRVKDHGRHAAVEVKSGGDEGGVPEAVVIKELGDNYRHDDDAEGRAGGHEAIGNRSLGGEVVRDDGEGQC